jgi:translation initiation factor 2 subunit 2
MEGDEMDEIAAMFDLSVKKKVKRTKPKPNAHATTHTTPATENEGTPGDADNTAEANSIILDATEYPQYTYSQLLTRLYSKITTRNEDTRTEKRKLVLNPPQLFRLGTKKTMWVNFQDICTTISRSPEHVSQYVMTELGAESSTDGNHRLIMQGKFQPMQIQNILRKYVAEYVACGTCKNTHTTLIKDQISRLHMMECHECKSTRSVAAIKTGFHAQTRADRRAQRDST